jgi:hypothetical protein
MAKRYYTISELQREVKSELDSYFGPGHTGFGEFLCSEGATRNMGPHATLGIPGKRPLTKEDVEFALAVYLNYVRPKVAEVIVGTPGNVGRMDGTYTDLTFVHRHLCEAEKDLNSEMSDKQSCWKDCEECKAEDGDTFIDGVKITGCIADWPRSVKGQLV